MAVAAEVTLLLEIRNRTIHCCPCTHNNHTQEHVGVTCRYTSWIVMFLKLQLGKSYIWKLLIEMTKADRLSCRAFWSATPPSTKSWESWQGCRRFCGKPARWAWILVRSDIFNFSCVSPSWISKFPFKFFVKRGTSRCQKPIIQIFNNYRVNEHLLPLHLAA